MKETMQIKVDVNEEAIAKGQHRKICGCPIALAVNREIEAPEAYPRLCEASVHLTEGHVTLEQRDPKSTHMKRYIYKFDLPLEVQRFVSDWDARKEVAPIAFDMELKLKGEKTLMQGTV